MSENNTNAANARAPHPLECWRLYQKKQSQELREVTPSEIEMYKNNGFISAVKTPGTFDEKTNELMFQEIGMVSISQADLDNGSPKLGDMIARNKDNHADQWLVSEEFFQANYIPAQSAPKPLPPHVMRMATEHDDLLTKIKALVAFVESNPIYQKLSEQEQQLMLRQLKGMQDYEHALKIRLESAVITHNNS